MLRTSAPITALLIRKLGAKEFKSFCHQARVLSKNWQINSATIYREFYSTRWLFIKSYPKQARGIIVNHQSKPSWVHYVEHTNEVNIRVNSPREL